MQESYSEGLTSTAGVVLAAGRGSRMGGIIPKVLLEVAGKTMLAHVFDALRQAGVSPVCVVVSPVNYEMIKGELGTDCLYAVQKTPRGSGDAVLAAKEILAGLSHHVVVACGDSPLFRVETLERMIQAHISSGAFVTLASAVLENPLGYGRIIRDASGRISAIVEQRDATDDQAAVKEVNGGLYVFRSGWLWHALDNEPDNGEQEFVLTRIIVRAVSQNLGVESVDCHPDELVGINTPEQLAAAQEILRKGMQ